jgi:hypothetical protein
MARRVAVPKYCLHKASNRAFVFVRGSSSRRQRQPRGGQKAPRCFGNIALHLQTPLNLNAVCDTNMECYRRADHAPDVARPARNSLGGWVLTGRLGTGQSSFTIVAVPTPSLSVAPTALLSCTVNVSFGSRLRSPAIEMEIVLNVSPGWNVKVPDVLT